MTESISRTPSNFNWADDDDDEWDPEEHQRQFGNLTTYNAQEPPPLQIPPPAEHVPARLLSDDELASMGVFDMLPESEDQIQSFTSTAEMMMAYYEREYRDSGLRLRSFQKFLLCHVYQLPTARPAYPELSSADEEYLPRKEYHHNYHHIKQKRLAENKDLEDLSYFKNDDHKPWQYKPSRLGQEARFDDEAVVPEDIEQSESIQPGVWEPSVDEQEQEGNEGQAPIECIVPVMFDHERPDSPMESEKSGSTEATSPPISEDAKKRDDDVKIDIQPTAVQPEEDITIRWPIANIEKTETQDDSISRVRSKFLDSVVDAQLSVILPYGTHFPPGDHEDIIENREGLAPSMSRISLQELGDDFEEISLAEEETQEVTATKKAQDVHFPGLDYHSENPPNVPRLEAPTDVDESDYDISLQDPEDYIEKGIGFPLSVKNRSPVRAASGLMDVKLADEEFWDEDTKKKLKDVVFPDPEFGNEASFDNSFVDTAKELHDAEAVINNLSQEPVNTTTVILNNARPKNELRNTDSPHNIGDDDSDGGDLTDSESKTLSDHTRPTTPSDEGHFCLPVFSGREYFIKLSELSFNTCALYDDSDFDAASGDLDEDVREDRYDFEDDSVSDIEPSTSCSSPSSATKNISTWFDLPSIGFLGAAAGIVGSAAVLGGIYLARRRF